jgi:hypothetical protein
MSTGYDDYEKIKRQIQYNIKHWLASII